MTRSRGWCAAALAAVLLAAAPRPACAQSSAQLLARGISAVQNLDYDSAAVLLRTALGRIGADVLPDTARTRALMFLGAVEFFRDRRDSATAVFGRLLAFEPRYRPDQLLFPPEVTSHFEGVRAGLRLVAVRLAPQTELAGPGDRLVIRVYATTLHDLTAAVTRRGAVVRTIFRGAIGDSLELLWDGRDSAGAAVDSGAAQLRFTSRAMGSARAEHAVEVPLEVRVARRDTLPWPPAMPDSILLPETTPGGHGARALAGGFLAAAAVAVLPSVVASGASGSPARYGVAAATGLAGIAGFLRGRRAQPIPANVASNQALRASWQRRLADVRAENEVRRRDVRVTIRAGQARQVAP